MAMLACPPRIEEFTAVARAMFTLPPLTEAQSPLISLYRPATRPPKCVKVLVPSVTASCSRGLEPALVEARIRLVVD
jgi:hypothetical protein